MKYITGALVLLALFNVENANAIILKGQGKYTDDLAKMLAESDSKDEVEEKKPEPAPAKKAEEKKPEPAKKAEEKKPADKKAAAPVKKEEPKKKEEDDIPMDAAAIKAYSSVIADAAEDSEPAKPVIYTETMQEEKKQPENIGLDPMGSMI